MDFQLKDLSEMVKNKKQEESMMAHDSLHAKWNVKRMEEDEGLRTVACLRGRLLAERAASKAANDESEQIREKVTELENQLKIEIKSRNKAEKRLKLLMKKLDSLNISYVSRDESSSFSEKSEISSVSSSKSQHQIELKNPNLSKIHNCPSHEDNLGSLDEDISENSKENLLQSSSADGIESDLQKEDHNGVDHNSMALVIIEKKVIMTPRNDEDNSKAIVLVDSKVKEEENEDVSILNKNVKDVLDSLRFARESLQTSMDMKRHIESNIAPARLDSISSC